MMRLVRNYCTCCPRSARVLTVEDGKTGLRLSGGGHWRYSTLEDPAVLTAADLQDLRYTLAHEDRLTVDMRAAIEAGIASLETR